MVSFLWQLERILYGLGSNPHSFQSHPPRTLLDPPASTTPSSTILKRHLSAGTVFRVTSHSFSPVWEMLHIIPSLPSSGAPRASGPRPRSRLALAQGSAKGQAWGEGRRAVQETGSLWVDSATRLCPCPARRGCSATVHGCGELGPGSQPYRASLFPSMKWGE